MAKAKNVEDNRIDPDQMTLGELRAFAATVGVDDDTPVKIRMRFDDVFTNKAASLASVRRFRGKDIIVIE